MAAKIRSLLAFITSVLFLCAWILLGIGVWLVVDPMYYEPSELLEIENFLNCAYLILVTASVLILLTFLIGTVLRNENEKLLSIFVVGMIIVLLLSLASVVLFVSYGFNEKLQDYLARQIILKIRQVQYEDPHAVALINFIQMKFKCCGANYITDYENFRMHYPLSCTNDVYDNPNFLYFEGCAPKMSRFYETRAAIILGIFSFISFFVIFSITLSIMFYCSLVNFRSTSSTAENNS